MTGKREFVFLVGKALSSISLSAHQIILNFGDNVSISCEAAIVHVDRLGTRDRYESFKNAATPLSRLIEETVSEVGQCPDNALSLRFSNGEAIEFVKDDGGGGYESYVITYDGRAIVE